MVVIGAKRRRGRRKGGEDGWKAENKSIMGASGDVPREAEVITLFNNSILWP